MTIEECLEKFSAHHGFPLERNESGMISFCIDGENGKFDVYTIIEEEEKIFALFVDMNIRVPKEKKEDAALLLLEYNQILKNGSFYMNIETGDIMARITQYVYGEDWEKMEQIERVILLLGVLADAYYTKLLEKIVLPS